MGNASIDDSQVAGYLRANKSPNWLKTNFKVSVERSKKIAAEHGIVLQVKKDPVSRAGNPTDGPTDQPTDGIQNAAREATPAPAASNPPSVGQSVGPTDLLTAIPTRVQACTGCGVLTPRDELTSGLCQNCTPGVNGSTPDIASPSFIKNDSTPSFCGNAPPRSEDPTIPGVRVPLEVLVALAAADEALWFLDHYGMFEDKRYKNVKSMIHDTAVKVRAAVKAI